MTRSSVAKIDFETKARQLRPGDVFGGVVIVRRLSPLEVPIKEMQFRVRCPTCGHEQALTWIALYVRATRATGRCHRCRYEVHQEKKADPGWRLIAELPEAQRPRPWSAERVLALWDRANARVARRGDCA